MDTFHFLRPEWLWGFLPLVGLLVFLARRKATAQLWESVCDAHLLPHVLVGTTGAKSSSPIILLGLGWTLALVALAGPVWSQLPQPGGRPPPFSAFVTVRNPRSSFRRPRSRTSSRGTIRWSSSAWRESHRLCPDRPRSRSQSPPPSPPWEKPHPFSRWWFGRKRRRTARAGRSRRFRPRSQW